MLISFYKCNNDKRCVNKSLTNEVTYNCNIKDGANSVLSPVIQITQFEGFAGYNYAYIPNYGRYYYINNVSVDLGGLITLSLSVDVLYTYRDVILNTQALIYRQSDNYNVLLSDGLIQSQVNEVIVTRPFSGGELTNQLGSNAHNFVLTAYKGGTA